MEMILNCEIKLVVEGLVSLLCILIGQLRSVTQISEIHSKCNELVYTLHKSTK